MTERMEQVAANLQHRIGELVKQYEGDIAVLKTDVAKQIADLEAEVKRLTDELAEATKDNVKQEPTKPTNKIS